MSPNNFFSLESSEKEIIFQEISNDLGMPVFSVEKDWWVSQTLAIIFSMNDARHMVFKGGTSLSKAWKLIYRLSEDIDLAVD
jgi:predicted nucleotidyltransferase component of viral defense system